MAAPARSSPKHSATPDGGAALSLFLYGTGVMPDDLRERLREFVRSGGVAIMCV